MKYHRLLAGAVVVPENESWGPQTLGAGTIVGVLPNSISPLTGGLNELYVAWLDVAGRENRGWIASRTPLQPYGRGLHRAPFQKTDALTAWDHMRYHMAWPAKYRVPMALSWMAREGYNHRSEILAVIRELGGRVSKSDDTDVLIGRALRLITNQEITMEHLAELNETETATKTKKNKKSRGAKKGAKKVSSKKSAGKKSAKRVTAKQGNRPGRESQYAGKVIVRLVKENPRREGTHGHASWQHLRKGITYEQFIEAGGRRVDLAWDIAKGNVKLVNKK